MFQEERVKKILDFITAETRASVVQLSKKFNVSKVTIRRDLAILSDQGLILKTHGGAILMQEKLSFDIPYKEKSLMNINAKQKIGSEAAKLIKDNDIIILDAGSTTLEIAKRITQKNITVITNDFNIALEIANNSSIGLIVTGGTQIKGVYTLIGDEAVEMLKKIHVNKTFLGCDALDLEFGISNRHLYECKVKMAMIDAALEVIMVCDKGKFDKKVSFQLCGLSRINKIITDSISDRYLNALNENKIEVICAN
ncbi:MAG: DeoR/GlpR transcriptional regulator [Actinobacteria bacterium]|nr:DeoR/GlpR transcriptional regulator [Actinomycetota bacterium]